jgi:hypothetical protein
MLPEEDTEGSLEAWLTALPDTPNSTPPWARRLPPRLRIQRAIVVTTALLLTLLVVLAGPAALTALAEAWQQLAGSPMPLVSSSAPTLLSSAWTAATLPAGVPGAANVALRPSPADPDIAYACWVTGPPGGPGGLQLAATTDGARSWHALASPLPAASGCALLADAIDPQRALLLAFPLTRLDCDSPLVFATGDGGTDWSEVPLPYTVLPTCDPALLALGGTLYLWSGDGAAGLGPARLLASADGGTSWQTVAGGLPAGMAVMLVAGRVDGALLALVCPPDGGAGCALWDRPAGHPSPSWQQLGAVPGSFPLVYAASAALPASSVGGGWGPLYVLVRPGAEPAADAVGIQVWTHGGAWRILPPVQLPGGRVRTADGRALRLLAVGPGGMLLMEVPGAMSPTAVSASVDTGPVQSGALFAWVPEAGHWVGPLPAEPGNAAVAGLSWDGRDPGLSPRLVLWLLADSTDANRAMRLYRATLTAIG